MSRRVQFGLCRFDPTRYSLKTTQLNPIIKFSRKLPLILYFLFYYFFTGASAKISFHFFRPHRFIYSKVNILLIYIFKWIIRLYLLFFNFRSKLSLSYRLNIFIWAESTQYTLYQIFIQKWIFFLIRREAHVFSGTMSKFADNIFSLLIGRFQWIDEWFNEISRKKGLIIILYKIITVPDPGPQKHFLAMRKHLQWNNFLIDSCNR